jgi:hypothetical protein
MERAGRIADEGGGDMICNVILGVGNGDVICLVSLDGGGRWRRHGCQKNAEIDMSSRYRLNRFGNVRKCT